LEPASAAAALAAQVKDVGRTTRLSMGTPRPSGESIIKALIERYSRLRTYRDRGAVYQELGTDGPAVEMTFETAYTSPNLFRFAFDSPHPFPPLKHLITRCVVGCDGTQSYFWIEYPGELADLRIEDDLATVVAGATGISGGSAHTIARLLLGGVGGLALSGLRDWAVAGSTFVDDIPCHQVVGVHPSGGRWDLVVERDSLLLRSLSRGLGGGRRKRQVRHDIHLNSEIHPDTFVVPRDEGLN
jgi:hypothetical protein